MAAVVGSVTNVRDFALAGGRQEFVASSTKRLRYALCDVTFPSGTYVQADDANFTVATLIKSTRKDGKTVTIHQACPVGDGIENGANIVAGQCTVTSGTIAFALFKDDGTTERDAGAMSATWQKPLTFCVSYFEPV